MRNVRRRGFTLVELMIVLAIIAVIAAFAIPNLMKSRMSANEASAIGSLRALMSAEGTYMNKYGIYGRMDQLLAEGLVDSSVAKGRKSGYVFGELKCTDFSYCFCACPAEDNRSGEKEYCITQKGTIYEANFDTAAVGAAFGGAFTVKWDAGSLTWPSGGFDAGESWSLTPESATDTWTPINQ
jgi:prepilin-type N-terminal cleavage/methylation domain-containing protein